MSDKNKCIEWTIIERKAILPIIKRGVCLLSSNRVRPRKWMLLSHWRGLPRYSNKIISLERIIKVDKSWLKHWIPILSWSAPTTPYDVSFITVIYLCTAKLSKNCYVLIASLEEVNINFIEWPLSIKVPTKSRKISKLWTDL